MKELYLDSANLDDIRSAIGSDVIAGVTTNPSLMSKETKQIATAPRFKAEKWDLYVKCLDTVAQTIQQNARSCKHLSVEVITLDPKEMFSQAMRLQEALGKWDRIKLYVKVPVLFETLDLISALSDSGVRVNATAVMTHLQAKLAHDAGAPIISFFYNRMKDEEHRRGNFSPEVKSKKALREILVFANEFNRNSRIICGSIRKEGDLSDCWRNGADIVTASLKIIKGALVHTQTEKAVNQFQEDIDKWLS